MTDKPIIMSAPMVRALLEGRKTQTRRVLKPQPHEEAIRPDKVRLLGIAGPYAEFEAGDGTFDVVRLPYAPGDRLWVREAWAHVNATGSDAKSGDSPQTTLYRATCTGAGPYRWRPSIHMPRWASRLTLIVTDVRVERLEDISTEDAEAEGVKRGYAGGAWGEEGLIEDFAALWNSLHKPGFQFDDNPWVCALTFTVHHANIDDLREAA